MKYDIILVQDIISVISDQHGKVLPAVDNSDIKAYVDVMNAAIRQSEEKTKVVQRAVEDEYHQLILDNIAKYEQLPQDVI